MSKAKFEAAKLLIDDKDYPAARAILKTIDHPTAREWEHKLDALSPPKPKSNSGFWIFVTLVVIGMLLALSAFYVTQKVQDIRATTDAARLTTEEP